MLSAENPRYRIAEITQDKFGLYWVYWAGEHAAQGGSEVGYSSLGGFVTVADAADFLKRTVIKNEELVRRLIEQKDDKSNPDKT